MKPLIPILLILLFFGYIKFMELIKIKALFNHISWCIVNHYQLESEYYSSTRDLASFVCGLSISDYIPNKYELSEVSDIKHIEAIIEDCQKDLCKKYFKNELSTKKDILKLSNEDYFMLSLCGYLDKHECACCINNNEIHSDILKKEGNTSTYSLSDFGIVYFKLQHLAYAYLQHNTDNIVNNNNIEKRIENIRKTIDSKQITITRYIP